MTREETIKAIGIIAMAYPASELFKDEKQLRSMVEVWANFFAEDDVSLVMMAIRQHISLSKWPPSIAEIRDIMVTISRPDIIPPDEAWALVSKFLFASGEFHEFDQHDVLPESIAETVDSIGYSTLYKLHVSGSRFGEKNAGLDRVAFLQAYTAKHDRQRDQVQLPETLVRSIQDVKARIGKEDAMRTAMLENLYQKRMDYFREIEERGVRWIKDADYAQLNAGEEDAYD